MQLKQLTLENFITHKDLTLDLSTHPVHLIFGRNGAGKTAIADALEFLMTGRCRGVRLKKDAAALLGRNGERFKITLDTSAQTFTRGPGSSDIRFKWSDALVGVLVNPMRLVGMTAADRQSVFRDALAGDGKTIGDIAQELKAPDWPEAHDDIMHMSTSDIDAAEKAAVVGRRGAKALLQSLQESDRTDAVSTMEYEGDPDPIDLTEVSVEEVRDQLSKLEAQHRGLLKSAVDGTPGEFQRKIDELEADSEEGQNELATVHQLRAVAQGKLRGGQEKAECEGNLSLLKAKLQQAQRALSGMSAQDGKCVLSSPAAEISCPHGADVIGAICTKLAKRLKVDKATCDKLQKRLDAGKEDIREATEELAAQTLAAERIRSARQGREARMEQLEGLMKAATDWARVEGQATELQARIAKGHAILTGATAYQTALRAAEGIEAQKVKTTAAIEAWDGLCKLLGKDGPVRARLTEAMSTAQIDTDLQKAWGCTVEVRADGGVLFNGRPIELASYSEQWRASMLVADVLSRTVKAGFIVLDQADSLDLPGRTRLTDWLERHDRNGYQTILVLAAADKPLEAPWNPEWVKRHWLGGGE